VLPAALLRAFARCRRGAVAVELAFFAPVVIVIAIAAAEYGRAYAVRLRLEAAARDGLQAAVDQVGADASLTQVQSAVQSLIGQGATVTVTRACACQGATSACDTLCAGTVLPEMRLQVSAQQSLAPMTFYPGHDGSLTLTATALLRVR
jgi:Flp pilus assembly protein TadG